MATIEEHLPEQGGRQDPPTPSRKRRPWVWAALVAVTALGIWVYTLVSEPVLVGTWSNRATDIPIVFTFNEDGSGSMTIGVAQLPYQYRFDQTRNPAWLYLDATVEGRSVSIRAIAQFTRGDKLKIRMPHTRAVDIRPNELVDNDLENTIILTRITPAS